MQLGPTGAAVLSTLNRASTVLETQRVASARLANTASQVPEPSSVTPAALAQTGPTQGITPGQQPLSPNAVTALQQAEPTANAAAQPGDQPGTETQDNPTAIGAAPPPPPPPAPPPGEQRRQAEPEEPDPEQEQTPQQQRAEAQQEEEGTDGLTPSEERQVQELQQRDAEVRRHEQAHAAVGGPYAGAPTYEYQRGPDDRLYAIGGEVSIDTSAIPGDPAATIAKLQQVRRAALAPAEPSPQDRRVAADASSRILEARSDLRELQAAERADQAAERAEAFEASRTEEGEGEQFRLERPNLSAEGVDAAQIAEQTGLASPALATDDSASRNLLAAQAFADAQALRASPTERGGFF